MARCQWCTAPLPPNHAVCRYCGKRNDVDLRGVHEFTVVEPDAVRICPLCEIPMKTLDLKLGETFLIERCEKCLSLFFDPNEVETLLEKSADAVFQIDHQRLGKIAGERCSDNKKIRYFKCPVCRTIMNRIHFGARSGVIVDQCVEHGMWLEAGELRRLLEWKRAGGQILDARRKEEREKERREQEMKRAREALKAGADPNAFFDRPDDGPFAPLPDPTETVQSFVRAVIRLFR